MKDIKQIKWKTFEYFECHKDDFKKIYQTVRNEVTKYEEFIFKFLKHYLQKLIFLIQYKNTNIILVKAKWRILLIQKFLLK